MNEVTLRELVADIKSGAIEADEAVARLRHLPYKDLGFAKVDHHRIFRQGLPEAVYAPGKTPQQCAEIVAELLERGQGPVILSRPNQVQIEVAMSVNDGGHQGENVVTWHHGLARSERIVVATAGTADLPVAKEAEAVLIALGFDPSMIIDCGVAGIHRLLDNLELLEKAQIVIVVAGMEGALASVIGGLTAAPVIAVPTSVGYGSSLEGVTALMAMTSSCASGVTVIGIDNGFGAACAAARLANQLALAIKEASR